MDDFSWVAPATKNLANLFGLNPELAARGRNMQSENDLLLARTANTQADTGLSPFRQRVLEAQTGTQGALAGKYKADTGKTEAETAGITMTNAARKRLSDAFASGALVNNDDGSVTIAPGSVSAIANGLSAMSANPTVVMDSIRGLQGNAAQTPRAAAQTRGIPAAFEADASFSASEGDKILGNKAAASQAEAIAVQQEKNRGSLAESFAKSGGAPAAPDQMDLNRQIEAIKEGAAWAMKVPLGPSGGFLNEEQAMGLAQAARAANPNLNVPDAIRKFIQDNPKMLKGNWEMFGNNKVDIPGGIPSVVPSAPAAPAAAASAPAAPAAQSGTMTKEKFAALPEGGAVVLNGVKYVKQGRQLVKAQ